MKQNKALGGTKVELSVPGTDKTAEVYVITSLESPYGIVQDWISDEILTKRKFFEEDEVRAVVSCLSEGDLFVDVGANIGSFTAAARAVGAETISVEPQPILQKTLKKNAGKGEVHAVGAGTSEERLTVHEAYMRHPRRGTIMANLGGNDLKGTMGRRKSEIEVEVRTLDSIIGTRNPKVIKVDVEGMEADVLASGMRTIKRCRPIIFAEQNHSEEMAECWKLLKPLEYRIADVIGGMGSSVVVRYEA